MSSAPEPYVTPEQYLTTDERATLQRLLSQSTDFPKEFGAWIKEYIAVNGELQQYQVTGLSQRTPRSDSVATQESCNWTSSYVDLATVGPQLTDLSAGVYLVNYGAQIITHESASQPYMGISINGAAPVDADSMFLLASSGSIYAPSSKSLIIPLTLPSNTLRCQYKRIGSGASTGDFSGRYINAVKVAAS